MLQKKDLHIMSWRKYMIATEKLNTSSDGKCQVPMELVEVRISWPKHYDYFKKIVLWWNCFCGKQSSCMTYLFRPHVAQKNEAHKKIVAVSCRCYDICQFGMSLWALVLELLSEQLMESLTLKIYFTLINKQQRISSCLFSWKYEWMVNYSIMVVESVKGLLMKKKADMLTKLVQRSSIQYSCSKIRTHNMHALTTGLFRILCIYGVNIPLGSSYTSIRRFRKSVKRFKRILSP